MLILKGDNKFYIKHKEDESISEINFIEDEEKITVDHIYVQEKFRGGKIALELIEKTVEYAKKTNKKIYPVCAYVKKKLMKNKEKYKNIIIDDKTMGTCKILTK